MTHPIYLQLQAQLQLDEALQIACNLRARELTGQATRSGRDCADGDHEHSLLRLREIEVLTNKSRALNTRIDDAIAAAFLLEPVLAAEAFPTWAEAYGFENVAAVLLSERERETLRAAVRRSGAPDHESDIVHASEQRRLLIWATRGRLYNAQLDLLLDGSRTFWGFVNGEALLLDPEDTEMTVLELAEQKQAVAFAEDLVTDNEAESPEDA